MKISNNLKRKNKNQNYQQFHKNIVDLAK